ncbi:unnamed protein product [Rotaria sp. Silwood2]|nr:unnamed protein product [Rotaria sp. Silwood2]
MSGAAEGLGAYLKSCSKESFEVTEYQSIWRWPSDRPGETPWIRPSVLSSIDQQQPQPSIRQIVREKLHKRSSSDLQQSLSSIDISTKIDINNDDYPMVRKL